MFYPDNNNICRLKSFGCKPLGSLHKRWHKLSIAMTFLSYGGYFCYIHSQVY